MIRCCCYCYCWCYVAFNANLKSCFSQHVPDGSYTSRLCMQQQLNRNRTVSLVTFNLTKWWTKLTKAYATENEDEKNFVPIVVTYRPTQYTHLHAVSQFRWKYTDKFRTFNAALYWCCCLFACTIFRFSFSETSNTCSFDPNNEVIKSKRNCSAIDSKVKPICYSKYKSSNMEKWSKKINRLFNLC